MNHHQVSRKVLRRLYEPLLLLDALGQARGTPIKQDLPSDLSDPAEFKARRVLADAIAYLAACEKDSAFITAVALQRASAGMVVVWLAANGGIQHKVIEFLEILFGIVHAFLSISPLDNGHQENIDEAIDHVLLFNAERNLYYYRKIRTVHFQPCFDLLQNLAQEESGIHCDARPRIRQLATALTRLFKETEHETPTELARLALECHHLRSQGLLSVLEVLSRIDIAEATPFNDLVILLYKLGKHVTLTRKLFEASSYCRADLRSGIKVRTVACSQAMDFPLYAKEASINSTLGRMYTKEDSRDRFRDRLRATVSPDQITEILSRSRIRKTKVHAELLLMDQFDNEDIEFLDMADRYIACSKQSCYLCHTYISYHPRHYTVSASHQKLYIQWRVPDILDKTKNPQERAEFLKTILLKMIQKIRADLEEEIDHGVSRLRTPPDSTIGITTMTSDDAVLAWLAQIINSDAVVQSASVYRSSERRTQISTDQDALDSCTIVADHESSDEDGGVSL